MQKIEKSKPDSAALEQINRFTRRTLTADEVYTFSVILCDNEVDRDGERFTVPALQKLAELFVGKTGIFDHHASGKNQTARIYATAVVADESRRTSQGEPYTALKAEAYLLRSDGNAALIADIDGGIKKEVSVSCSMSGRHCSICGADLYHGGCSHRTGEMVDGKLCHVVLSEPTDAYEFSFVAIPAQPRAGVTKALGTLPDIEKALAVSDEVTLTRAVCEELTRKAAAGESYRKKLKADAVRLSHALLPELSGALADRIVSRLDIAELEAFNAALQKRANRPLCRPQTAAGTTDDFDSSVYQI